MQQILWCTFIHSVAVLIIGHGEDMDGVLVNDDLNELTMGEKLADLYLLDNDKSKSHETQDSSPAKPPSADSVNVLLKQALRADDRALLLECLYNQDKKVVFNNYWMRNGILAVL